MRHKLISVLVSVLLLCSCNNKQERTQLPVYQLVEQKQENGFTISTIILKETETNVQLLIADNNECILIDPAYNSNKIIRTLKGLNLKVVGIFLTHNHSDHSSEINKISQNLNIKFWTNSEQHNLNASEIGTLLSEDLSEYVQDNEILHCGAFTLRVMYTPGHSEGAMCLYHKKSNTLFSGDTVFKGSIGRYDLEGSVPNEVIPSIKRLFSFVTSNTDIYPGHGEATTVSYELENNPYL